MRPLVKKCLENKRTKTVPFNGKDRREMIRLLGL